MTSRNRGPRSSAGEKQDRATGPESARESASVSTGGHTGRGSAKESASTRASAKGRQPGNKGDPEEYPRLPAGEKQEKATGSKSSRETDIVSS